MTGLKSVGCVSVTCPTSQNIIISMTSCKRLFPISRESRYVYVSILCFFFSLIHQFKVGEENDYYPKIMCSSCFSILNDFNQTKNIWIDNQNKFEDILAVKTETVEPLILEEVQTMAIEKEEIQDDTKDEAVEYGDEDQEQFEILHEDEYIEEDAETIYEPKVAPKRKSSRVEKTPKEKGRDNYQKLLQKCDICLKMIERNRMDGHMNKHNEIRPYVCDEPGCGKPFYCKLLLRLHRKSMHTGTSIPCDVCLKHFPSERSLYAHKLRHRNEGRYSCDYCNKSFNNSNSLKRHLLTHSGVREFSCDYCLQAFYRKFNLGEFNQVFVSNSRFKIPTSFRCSHKNRSREGENIYLRSLH